MERFGILNRLYSPKQTTGILTLMEATKDHGIDELLECRTVELPWKNNQREISCYPEGLYKLTRHESPTHGICFWIRDVPNRSGILLHKANYWHDLLGCTGPGEAFTDIDGDGCVDVTYSKKTTQKILDIMPDVWYLRVTSLRGEGIAV